MILLDLVFPYIVGFFLKLIRGVIITEGQFKMPVSLSYSKKAKIYFIDKGVSCTYYAKNKIIKDSVPQLHEPLFNEAILFSSYEVYAIQIADCSLIKHKFLIYVIVLKN